MGKTMVLAVVVGLLALIGGALAIAEEASGELPIDVEVPQSLVVGEGRPFIKLQARDAVRGVKVMVKRAGSAKQYRVASMSPGQHRTFQWNERPGFYSYTVTVQAKNAAGLSSQSFTWELDYLPAIKMALSRSRVDLAKRQLTFELNHPADRAELVVRGPDGVVLTRTEESYDGARPGTPLTIGWSEVADTITRIEVTGYGAAGHWTGMAVTPWSISIPHEEVEFATNESEIRPSEAPKLDRAIELIHKALREHGDELAVSLYVGGFTDTVGSVQHNRELSQKRARAIAQYFAKNAVKIPILYRGFGEEVLAVESADETAEARNRRALYILSPQAPVLSKSVDWGSWRRL
jgi:flagellar motor protein MotB